MCMVVAFWSIIEPMYLNIWVKDLISLNRVDMWICDNNLLIHGKEVETAMIVQDVNALISRNIK